MPANDDMDDDQPATRGDLHRMEARLEARLGARFSAELALHVKALEEFFVVQLRASDDRYRDLPARVTRLEDAVFKPRAPRARSRR